MRTLSRTANISTCTAFVRSHVLAQIDTHPHSDATWVKVAFGAKMLVTHTKPTFYIDPGIFCGESSNILDIVTPKLAEITFSSVHNQHHD